MKAKKIYLYDPATCSYRVVEKNFWYYTKRLLAFSAPTLFFALLFLTVFYALLHESEEVKAYKQANYHLENALDSFRIHMVSKENKLLDMQQKDRELYRTILNADPLEEKDSMPQEVNLDNANTAMVESELEDLHQQLENIAGQLESSSGASVMQELANMTVDELQKLPTIRPIESKIISGFGIRKHPITQEDRFHTGIDFRADMRTPVRATGDGVVVHTGFKNNGYGKFITLSHTHDYASKYAHLDEIIVKKGQRVKRGQIIGYSGNSGLTKGPHLHYEILKEGKSVDPIDYFFMDVNPEDFIKLKEQASQYNESMG